MKNLSLILFTIFQLLTSIVAYAQSDYTEISEVYANYKSELSKDRISDNIDIEEFLANLPAQSKITKSEIKDVLRLLVYFEKSDLKDQANTLLNKLLPKVENTPVFKAFLYQQLASLHFKEQELIPALENYLKASHIYEGHNEPLALAITFRQLSRINLVGGNPEQALMYSKKAYEIFYENPPTNRKDSVVLRSIFDYSGLSNRSLSNHKEAINDFNKSVDISLQMNDSVMASIAKGNKAVSYFDLGNYETALPLLLEDFNISNRNEMYGSAFNAGIYIARIYQAMGEMQKMDSTFSEIKKIQSVQNFTNPLALTDYYLLGADIAAKKENHQEAIDYYKAFVLTDHIRDSTARLNDISTMQEKYLLDKEISKLDLLQQKNELQASQVKLRTAFLIIIAIALVAVLLYVYTLKNKNKKIDKLNELLEAKVSERTARLLQINKELDTYLYRASHDIRRPIRTLLGLNNIAQLTTDTELMQQLFSKVHHTAMGMDKMLFKLQMAYELNNSHHIEEVEIETLTYDCIKDLSLEIAEHNSNVIVNIKEEAKTVKANVKLLRIAIDNILENALLYQNDSHNDIEIFTDIGNYFFYIHVKDQGFGIPEEYFEDLFKPYFKISNKTQGSGLGLFLASRAISFLAGEIAVISKVNEGSQFTIKIPINPK